MGKLGSVTCPHLCSGDCENANKYLFGVKKLFERSAVSNQQQEEASVWKIDFFTELSATLRKNYEQKKLNDSDAKIFYRMKAAPLVQFLSGEKKRQVVQQRKNHTTARMVKE